MDGKTCGIGYSPMTRRSKSETIRLAVDGSGLIATRMELWIAPRSIRALSLTSTMPASWGISAGCRSPRLGGSLPASSGATVAPLLRTGGPAEMSLVNAASTTTLPVNVSLLALSGAKRLARLRQTMTAGITIQKERLTMNRLKGAKPISLTNRYERACARLAIIAMSDVTFGGARALRIAKRASLKKFPAMEIVSQAYESSTGEATSFIPYHCHECGQACLGMDAAYQCCAPSED
jgi:hypothetical protein